MPARQRSGTGLLWMSWGRSVADSLAPRELHEQRSAFYLHGANFYTALAEAERLSMEQDEKALTQSLAVWAQNNRDFAEAERLFLRCARHEDTAAGAYHQLGRVAQERRDFAAAEQWYRKSLAISEKEGDEHNAAMSYHQLGRVAEEQRDFAAAEQWYRKSLAIREKQGNEHGAASTYHQLGRVAEVQGRLIEAGGLCLRALIVFLKTDPHSAQIATRQFARIHKAASAEEKDKLSGFWAKAGLGSYPPTENS